MMNGLTIHEPVALLFNGEPSERTMEFLKQIPEVEGLIRHDYNKVTALQTPEESEKEDYTYENDDEEEEFDKKGFDAGMKEYKEEQQQYEKDIKAGKYQKALLKKNGDFYPVYFNLDPPPQRAYSDNGKAVTMKVVQDAIKAGTATVELLDNAIAGIKQREERAKELDRDKIQKTVHKQFQEKTCDISTITVLTEADQVTARLLIYQSLDYSSRQKGQDVLFKSLKGYGRQASENLYDVLRNLTDIQYSYLIRMAIAGKSDSKFPNNDSGVTLYKVAEGAGLDVKKIETDQESKAATRSDRVKERLKDLYKRKSKVK